MVNGAQSPEGSKVEFRKRSELRVDRSSEPSISWSEYRVLSPSKASEGWMGCSPRARAMVKMMKVVSFSCASSGFTDKAAVRLNLGKSLRLVN